MDLLVETVIKVMGQVAPRPTGPIVEALARDLLKVQDAQTRLLHGLERDVGRLLDAHWNAGRGFLDSAGLGDRELKERNRDLRKARDEFKRAAAVYSEPTLARAMAYTQASVTETLLNDFPAARDSAEKAWRDAVACLYQAVEVANRPRLGSAMEWLPVGRRRRLPVQEARKLEAMSNFAAARREVIVRLAAPQQPSAPRRGDGVTARRRGPPRSRAERIQPGQRSRQRLRDCRPHHAVRAIPQGEPTAGSVYVERGYEWSCVTAKAWRLREHARRHGLDGKVYGQASASDPRLCVRLLVPDEVDVLVIIGFGNDVKYELGWDIDVEASPPWTLRGSSPIA